MKLTLATTVVAGLLAAPALAGGHASGDAAAGEKAFNQCKSCHMIEDADGNSIVKGGKTSCALSSFLSSRRISRLRRKLAVPTPI